MLKNGIVESQMTDYNKASFLPEAIAFADRRIHMAIIGIDLGTTNSLACAYRNGRAELIPNELGDCKTPSAVRDRKSVV